MKVRPVGVFLLLALLLNLGTGAVASGLAQSSSTEAVQVAPSAGFQWGARISGDTVVWVQEDPGTAPSTTGRVWVKSLSTGKAFPVSKAPGLQEHPDISGDIVVWEDTRNTCPTCGGDIYGYRLSAGQEFPIAVGPAAQGFPAISGSVVVWLELAEDQNRAIRGLDLASGQALEIASAPADPRSSYYPPALDGDVVVYAEESGNPKIPDTFSHVIYAYDLKTGTRMTVGEAHWIGSHYAVSGNRVVWSAGGVHVFDLSTGQDTVLVEGCYPTTLDIEGDLVVWGGQNRLAGYDLAEGVAFLVADAPGDQLGPSLSGRTVVWMSFITDELANIAMQKLPENPPPLPPR